MQCNLLLPHESLICGICYDLLESPYECSGCSNLFCEECLNHYLSTKDEYRRIYFCPICRSKKNNFTKNSKINKILLQFKNSGKKLCPKCKSIIEQDKYKEHINICWHKCNICKKIFSNEEKFLSHFSKDKNHDLENILNKFNRKANFSKKEENKNCSYGKIKREPFENNLVKKENIEEDSSDMVLIDRQGFNLNYDLYFCGKKNGINCKCCDTGICCPNGELCADCMKKNLKFHGLKRYYLINKKGRACKYRNGAFHCYSKFPDIKQDQTGNYFKTDKICSDDYTCEACKNITKLMNYYFPTNLIKKLVERDMQIISQINRNKNCYVVQFN